MLGKHDVSRGKSFNLDCLLVGCVRGGGGGGRGHLARSGMVWKMSLKFLFALDSYHQLLSGPSVVQMILIMKTKCSCLTLSGFFFVWWSVFFFWTEYYRAVKWLIHWFTRWTALISTYLFIPHVSNVSTDLVFCPTRKAFFLSAFLTTALVGKEGPCEKSLGTITEIATRRQEKTRQYPYISSRGQCVTGRLSWEKETFTDLKLLAALF